MSVDVARVAVKTVMKALYNHDVYLTADEQQQVASNQTDSLGKPPFKIACKVPTSKADYENYMHVLHLPE